MNNLPRVVLPEGIDDRIIAAALRLRDENIAEPVLISTDQIADLQTIDPSSHPNLDDLAAEYAAGPRKLKLSLARRLISKPLFFAGMLVKTGAADSFVAGVANPTRRVIEAAQMTVGLAPGITTPSSYFLMEIPSFLDQGPRRFVFADCALNVAPTAEELCDIALASARTAARILTEPARVALLSFSSHGSAQHERIDVVNSALSLIRERAPELAVDGELQFDSAAVPAVAAKKVKRESDVAGKANVFIFPNLDAANIGYKMTQYFANGRAIGPILQGFDKPVADLSRGATVDDVVATVKQVLQLT